MVLNLATLPAVLMGTTVNIAGLPFVHTLAGLVQKTPLTCGQLTTLAETEMPSGYTLAENRFGVVDLDCVVVARGPKKNPARWSMNLHRDYEASLKRGASVELMPRDQIYVNPRKTDLPVAGLSWYQGAAIAAALTQLQPHYLIRMITDEIYDRIVLSGDEEEEADVIARAHLLRRGVRDRAPVVGEAAEARQSEWGLIDVFGNSVIWTDSVHRILDVLRGKPFHKVDRVLRSAAWFQSPRRVRVADRHALPPRAKAGGVRFVAVPRVSLR